MVKPCRGHRGDRATRLARHMDGPSRPARPLRANTSRPANAPWCRPVGARRTSASPGRDGVGLPRPSVRHWDGRGSESWSGHPGTGQYVAVLPGVGKTHLAISLAVAAAESGRRVYYGTLADLVESLAEAKTAGNLARRLKVLTHPAVLVVDLCEVAGYVESGRAASAPWGERPVQLHIT